ncbi:hypothetical protein [Corynebacterium sp. A21]|uniref:hypothetical protein n=1 Tax=Corynebacterium sp. A21 TaxID=3457318 RepID=UPI003FD0B26A
MTGMTDVLILADSDSSALGSLQFWDGVLLVGCALAVVLGMRARGSFFGGVARSAVILAVWVFVLFIPLMAIGSLIGAAADNYDASTAVDVDSLNERK